MVDRYYGWISTILALSADRRLCKWCDLKGAENVPDFSQQYEQKPYNCIDYRNYVAFGTEHSCFLSEEHGPYEDICMMFLQSSVGGKQLHNRASGKYVHELFIKQPVAN